MYIHMWRNTGVCEVKTPAEKKTCGKISLQSTLSPLVESKMVFS